MKKLKTKRIIGILIVICFFSNCKKEITLNDLGYFGNTNVPENSRVMMYFPMQIKINEFDGTAVEWKNIEYGQTSLIRFVEGTHKFKVKYRNVSKMARGSKTTESDIIEIEDTFKPGVTYLLNYKIHMDEIDFEFVENYTYKKPGE